LLYRRAKDVQLSATSSLVTFIAKRKLNHLFTHFPELMLLKKY